MTRSTVAVLVATVLGAGAVAVATGATSPPQVVAPTADARSFDLTVKELRKAHARATLVSQGTGDCGCTGGERARERVADGRVSGARATG